MHENCSCVQCTVAFGLQLCNDFFPLWFELSSKARKGLKGIFRDIQLSTSALKQLQGIVDQDKLAAEGVDRIFTPAALEEIELLGLKCDLLFKAIILLLVKAAENQKKDEDEEYWSGGRRYRILKKQEKEEPKTDNEPALLIGPIPDLTVLTSLAMLKYFSRLSSSQGYWFEPRIEHCEEQLRWVCTGLQLQLRIAKLAQLEQPSSSSADRVAGQFETELLVRSTAAAVLDSRFRYVRAKAKKQEKAQRLWDLKEKRKAEKEKEEAERDDASIKSGSSQASARTAVDEGVPAVKSTAEKKDGGDVKLAPPPPPPLPMPLPPANVNRLPVLVPNHAGVVNNAQNGPSSEIPPLVTADVALGKKEAKDTTGNIRQKLSTTMKDIKHKIFGRDDAFTKDYESQELEAWVVQCVPWSDACKLPFGHRRLEHGLKKAYGKKDNLTTFGRYMKQSRILQSIIDEISLETNRCEARRKVFLVSDYHEREDGTSVMIVFFSIEEEKAPVKFTDCLNRKMTIPYEICKNWNLFGYILYVAFKEIPNIGPHVLANHFDLMRGNGELIPRPIFGVTLKPGDEVRMSLWPLENHPLPVSVPPFMPPPQDHLPRNIGMSATQHRRAREERLWAAGSLAPRPKDPGSPSLLQQMFPASRMMPRSWPPGPPPPPPPGMGRPGPPIRINSVRRPNLSRPGGRSSASTTTASTVDKGAMTRAEEKQLSFVDYAQELERARGVSLADLLARFTNMKDVGGNTISEFGRDLCDSSDFGFDTPSWAYSSGTESLVDD